MCTPRRFEVPAYTVQLFLRFQGPSTILLQTRGSRLGDSLTTRDVNEIADSPAGAIDDAIRADVKRDEAESRGVAPTPSQTRISYAGVRKDGAVEFEKTKGPSS